MVDGCKSLNSQGEPCGAAVVEGTSRCFMHSIDQTLPDQARLLGGFNRKTAKRGEFPGELDNIEDFKRWLYSAIVDTWALENSNRRSAALQGLLKLYHDALATAHVEDELEKLKGLIDHDGTKRS